MWTELTWRECMHVCVRVCTCRCICASDRNGLGDKEKSKGKMERERKRGTEWQIERNVETRTRKWRTTRGNVGRGSRCRDGLPIETENREGRGGLKWRRENFRVDIFFRSPRRESENTRNSEKIPASVLRSAFRSSGASPRRDAMRCVRLSGSTMRKAVSAVDGVKIGRARSHWWFVSREEVSRTPTSF